jgi:hypothetical protein
VEIKKMRSLVLAIGASILLAVSVSAQTVSDVGHNFSRTGKPGVWAGQGVNLSLKFDEAGQICEAVWPAEQYVDNVFLVGQSRVPAEQIKSILNLLAPRGLRGDPVGPLWGLGETGGGSGSYDYDYQNLKVTAFFAFQVRADVLRDAKPYTFTAEPAEEPTAAVPRKKTEVNFFERQRLNEEFSAAGVVLIRWKNRRCDPKP